MYINLWEIRYYFLSDDDESRYYFNTYDYCIYSQAKRDELVQNDEVYAEDMIPIPYIRDSETAEKYLESKNNKKLLKQIKESEFPNKKFWEYIELNNLRLDYLDFRDKELISFASAWCDSFNIKYTKIKPEFIPG